MNQFKTDIKYTISLVAYNYRYSLHCLVSKKHTPHTQSCLIEQMSMFNEYKHQASTHETIPFHFFYFIFQFFNSLMSLLLHHRHSLPYISNDSRVPTTTLSRTSEQLTDNIHTNLIKISLQVVVCVYDYQEKLFYNLQQNQNIKTISTNFFLFLEVNDNCRCQIHYEFTQICTS